MTLVGVDFTSAPSRRKPITVAVGELHGERVHLQRIEAAASWPEFERVLQRRGPWVGAFDFPFGLPREFVEAHALGRSTAEVVERLQALCFDRMGFRRCVDAWGNARPAGRRLVHRKTDLALPGVTSSSPLQTRYVPVGFMYFEGVSRLIRAGVTLPRMHAGDPERVAVEGYPGLLAFELIGRRSYKNRAEADRTAARRHMVALLARGHARFGLGLELPAAEAVAVVEDASGDRIDAVLCLMQAAWASTRAGFGVPADVDPLEGWIVSA